MWTPAKFSFPGLGEGHMVSALVCCGNSADIRGAIIYQVLSPPEEGRGDIPVSTSQVPPGMIIALCGTMAGLAALLSSQALGGGRILLGFFQLGSR